MPGVVPEIPGEPVDADIAGYLTEHVAMLCGTNSKRFPGSQPVSFQTTSLDMLEKMNFWVCEKSDGVRLLILIIWNEMLGQQDVFLVDRKQRYYPQPGLHFPHWEADGPQVDTLIDGELVTDKDPKTGETLRFYAFDCLVIHRENIMAKSLEKRFGRLRSWVVGPFERGLKEHPEWRDELPFELVAKTQELSYHIKQVLDVHVPALQHGHDGLIFTCAESAYVLGTDEKILKWKPPSENSIDFKLEIRFPPSAYANHEADNTAKPTFLLHTWLGGQAYEYFDIMDVTDDEWESWKESGLQYDDRIIECCWNTERSTWQFMRIRDDKEHANHKDIMHKILISIQDGVEIEALLSRSDAIKAAWKSRQARAQQSRPPPPPQQQGRPVGNGYGGGLRR